MVTKTEQITPAKPKSLTPEESLLLDFLIDSAIESIQSDGLSTKCKSSTLKTAYG